jgi:hypothetical protein
MVADGVEPFGRSAVGEATTGVGIRALTPVARWRSAVGRDPARALIVLMAVLAAGLQGLRLARPGGLLPGNASDTALYLGSAIRLVHGVLPYRDFVLLQPPGVVLLMSPFALLSDLVGSRWALGTVNLCTLLVAAANVALVGRLVRHRGWCAVLAACGFVAVSPMVYPALLNGMLEPLMDLFCLLGLSLVFERDELAGRRRMVLGGVVLGFAGAVLVASIVPVLVVAVLCALRSRRRLLAFVGGVVAGFAVPSLPFFATAPGTFVHDVVVAQLARTSGAQRTSALARLEYMTFGGGVVGSVIAASVILIAIILAFSLVRRQLTALEWFALAGMVTVVAMQFAIAGYYNHFAAMAVPFVALPVGIAVGRLASIRPGWVASAVTVSVAVLVLVLVPKLAVVSSPDWHGSVDAVVPSGACALSTPYQLTVMSNRFTSDHPGCTAMVDPFATRLAYSGDSLVRVFQDAISHTDYVVMSTPLVHGIYGPLLAPVRTYVIEHFRLVRSGHLYIYVRDGCPIA